MTITLIRGDARHLALADACVDLVVTSPPYFALRSYTDGGEHYAGQVGSEATPAEFVATLVECTQEWMRVLKPTGSIWVNLGDKYSTGNSGQSGMAKLGEQYSGGGHSEQKAKRSSGRIQGMQPKSLIGLPWRYALACIDDLGLILRAEVIWSKPNGLPESVTDRVRRSHEQWFHFVKQPRYFSAVDEIREPHADPRIGKAMSWEQRKARGDAMRQGEQSGTFGAGIAASPLGKLPGSVWEIASQPLTVPKELGIDHFAAFPMEWPRRIILGWSPSDGVVVDPFGGTGTTALVASMLGRRGISVDMSADYCRLAQWRTTDPKQVERASRPAKIKAKPTPSTASEWLAYFGI